MSAVPDFVSRALPADLARTLRTGRQMVDDRRDVQEDEHFPTGAPPLDRLLDGGLSRGATLELVAWGSSGRFSAVVGALAAATGRGDVAALVDLGDALDPQSARAAGVELERLLWTRPRHLKEALLAAEAVVAAGVPFVAVDLGVPPIPGGRGVEAFWQRLARAAATRRVALLVTSPYRVTGTAADSVIELGHRQAIWTGRGLEPRLLHSLSGRLDLVKGAGWRRNATEALTWKAPSPIAEITIPPLPSTEPPSAEIEPDTPRDLFGTPRLRAVPGGRGGRRRRSDAPPADPLMRRRSRPALRVVDLLDPVTAEASA